MTVPPLFGWEEILTVLVLLIAGAVAFLILGAAAATMSRRAEWEAWLDGRTSPQSDPGSDPGSDPTADRGSDPDGACTQLTGPRRSG